MAENITTDNQSWATPSELYDVFVENGCFDPCPLNDSPTTDGLSIDWQKYNFVNPPYCNIEPWVDKAIAEARRGRETWMLLPARTDRAWWRKLMQAHCEFIFIAGRLHFNGSKWPAPFPCVLVLVPCFSLFDTYRSVDLKYLAGYVGGLLNGQIKKVQP